VPLSELS